MPLKKKYPAENREKFIQTVLLCSVFVLFLAVYTSLAKYELTSGGSVKIGVARWNINLNGKDITGSSNTSLEDSIQFFIDSAGDSNAGPVAGKPEPGHTGYFEIQIDPADTEVSFAYQVALDKSRLPDHFSITSYSLNDDIHIDLPEDTTVKGEVFLNGKARFTRGDAQTIRYYWNWDEADAGGTQHYYAIRANVEVKQILSGPEPG